MELNYPDYREHLKTLMAKTHDYVPGVVDGYGHLHAETMKTGALDVKHKELMAVSIAIAVRCDGCIACHVYQALFHGATPEEILETIGVAVLMGGGPAMVYGMQALEAVEQFQQEVASKNPNGASRLAGIA